MKRISGDIFALTSSGNVDPHGIYVVQQTPNLTPLKLRMTFSGGEKFTVQNNETLTSAEFADFASYGSAWEVLSSSLATVIGSGTQISIQGSDSPPFGDFLVRAQASSFDVTVRNSNAGVFDTFGSGFSVNVLPEPMSAAFGVSAGLVMLQRRKL